MSVRSTLRIQAGLLLTVFCLMCCTSGAAADDATPRRPQRLLLLAQKPDGHPVTTHEYMAGMAILAKCLQPAADLQTIIVPADGAWKDGPELLDAADGAVLFLSQGAKWLSEDASRLAAFQRLAKRGGGLACIHWGMGTKTAGPIKNYVELFGGCHGGPDRRFKVTNSRVEPSDSPHPILQGIAAFDVHEEFYYALKFPRGKPAITPLVSITADEKTWPVGWAWTRADGGRSFGFSGGHFHKNWERKEYRRLVTQGILWTLKRDIPQGGLAVEVSPQDLKLPTRQPQP